MDTNQVMMLLGAGGIGLGIGLAVGRILTKRELEKIYEEELEREVARTKDFYAKVHKKGDFATPEMAALMVGIDFEKIDKAAEALDKYAGIEGSDYEGLTTDLGLPQVDEAVEEEEAGIVIRNVLNDTRPLKVNIFAKMPVPFVITEEQFLENEHDYEQHTFTYYMGDGILADERDQVVDGEERAQVGDIEKMWTAVDNDLTLLHVRNELVTAEFEIAKSEGSYKVEVLGLDE